MTPTLTLSGDADEELLFFEESSEPPQAAVLAAKAVTVSNAMSRVLSIVLSNLYVIEAGPDISTGRN
jgi:hypothetical protein